MQNIASLPPSTTPSVHVNRVEEYTASYYARTYLRHLNAPYGLLIRQYCRYLANFCFMRPAGISKGSKVLDVGCGVGILTEQFNRLGCTSIGIDISPAAIRKSVYPQSCFLVEDSSRLDYPNGYFDLVASREVLEHIPVTQIDWCIQEWDRVAKGVMIHIVSVAERGQSAFDDPTHLNVKPEQWWIDRFKEHGYLTLRKPSRAYFSLFGYSGYFMMTKGSPHL